MGKEVLCKQEVRVGMVAFEQDMLILIGWNAQNVL